MESKNKANSPAEIEILLHYHYSPRQHEAIDNPNYDDSFKAFVEAGLLKVTPDGYTANNGALSVYIEKLLEVEFPVQKWV